MSADLPRLAEVSGEDRVWVGKYDDLDAVYRDDGEYTRVYIPRNPMDVGVLKKEMVIFDTTLRWAKKNGGKTEFATPGQDIAHRQAAAFIKERSWMVVLPGPQE